MSNKSAWSSRTIRLLLLSIFLLASTLPAMSYTLVMQYEQVVKDSWGNEIGYRKVQISSPDDLPAGSPWRNYLNIRLNDGKTIFQYASETSRHLSRPLYLNLSDRNSVAYSQRISNGYEISLFNYINNFASDDSKRFLFLHEFGHVAMLNAYPSSYSFSGLDYGDDGRHYLDEILPNHNTAWVEGWANAFAAQRNNGMVFSLNMNNQNTLAFLQNNSFEEMTRNELFVCKVLYDSMFQLDSGRAKVFDAIARSGPHYSLLSFSRGYLNLYPNDRVALAQILVKNSHGKISLDELLNYVNGGSRTVSRELYTYLAQIGLVSPAAGTVAQPASQRPATTSSGSWFDRLFSWFSNVFKRKPSNFASSPSGSASAPFDIPSSGARPPSMPPEGGATAPEPHLRGEIESGITLAQAHERYYKAFANYNRAIANSAPNEQVDAAAQELREAKATVEALRRQLGNQH